MDGLTREERGEKLLEFLASHWGNLDKETFPVHADRLFGGFDNFEALCECVVQSIVSPEGGARALASLLIASLNASYELGRRSMLQ